MVLQFIGPLVPAAAVIRRPNGTATVVSNNMKRYLSSMPTDKQPWWSLSSLHKHVATIIATSLPEESLSSVHQSLSEKLSKENSHKSVSINEAINSARAREAHRIIVSARQAGASSSAQQHSLVNGNNNTIEKQKKEIERRAFEKARERMELELAAIKAAMERTQKEKDDEQRELELLQQQQQEEKEDNSIPHHPILGPQIASLSYKRIHLTSAATLASLPVYEKQRAYRHDRAKTMAKDKKKTLWAGIPGCIALYEDDDGRLSILDGQHRVGMMALLQEEQGRGKGSDDLANLDLDNVLVEVFFSRERKQQTEQQPQDDKAIIFTEINKSEPVKIIDLPGVASKKTRDIIDYAASHFYDQYPDMFSASQRCRAPHVNLDGLRDALFASDIISTHNISSGKELVEWITNKNNELGERYAVIEVGAQINGKKLSEIVLKKARKYDFYLGLESTWLYK